MEPSTNQSAKRFVLAVLVIAVVIGIGIGILYLQRTTSNKTLRGTKSKASMNTLNSIPTLPHAVRIDGKSMNTTGSVTKDPTTGALKF